MEMLELVLLLLSAVLISSVVSQLFPKLPTPLVQIVLGLLIAFLGTGRIDIPFDSEVFLVLFIAPLLYNEARDIDLGSLWKHKGAVIACAVGLVFFVALAVGYSLNALMPAIPLAAAIALGAALGPTDAVAVASLSKSTNIKPSIKNILSGEALFNDASGLVTFQFALIAATTGAFSLKEAAGSFAMSFFGGIALGCLCGLVVNLVIRAVREVGYEDTTFNVLFELFVPFMVYLIAEGLKVSGVITVVMCGIINSMTRRTSGVSVARTSIVSSSVWQVFTSTLNGIVFVLLGTQLPVVFISEFTNTNIDNTTLVLLVLVLTGIVGLTRYIWCLLMMFVDKPKNATCDHTRTHRLCREDLKDALILTFAGAKGAITLAIMFTLPLTFTDASGNMINRDLLIFLASGVIVCTLLLATFLLPVLAPKVKVKKSVEEERINNAEASLDILRSVIEELAERQTKETFQATRQVIAAYNDRIERIKQTYDMDDDSSADEVRLRAIAWQKEYIAGALEAGQIDEDTAQDVLDRIEETEHTISKQGHLADFRWRTSRVARSASAHAMRTLRRLPVVDPSQAAKSRRNLLREMYIVVMRKLEDEMTQATTDVNTEDIAEVLVEYQRSLRLLDEHAPGVETRVRVEEKADEIEALALRLELKYIVLMQEEERISKKFAARLRENVSLMQIDLKNRV